MDNQSSLTPEEKRLLNEESFETSSEYGQGRKESGSAVRVVDEAESIQRRVADLMKSGISETEAKEQAIHELEEKMDGKAPDLKTYIQRYSEIAIPKADLDKYELSDLNVRDSCLVYTIEPYGMNGIGLTGKRRESNFILYFVSSQKDLKWVFINSNDIGELRGPTQRDLSAGNMRELIRSRLSNLGFEMPSFSGKNIPLKVKQYQEKKMSAEKEAQQAAQFDF